MVFRCLCKSAGKVENCIFLYTGQARLCGEDRHCNPKKTNVAGNRDGARLYFLLSSTFLWCCNFHISALERTLSGCLLSISFDFTPFLVKLISARTGIWLYTCRCISPIGEKKKHQCVLLFLLEASLRMLLGDPRLAASWPAKAKSSTFQSSFINLSIPPLISLNSRRCLNQFSWVFYSPLTPGSGIEHSSAHMHAINLDSGSNRDASTHRPTRGLGNHMNNQLWFQSVVDDVTGV